MGQICKATGVSLGYDGTGTDTVGTRRSTGAGTFKFVHVNF